MLLCFFFFAASVAAARAAAASSSRFFAFLFASFAETTSALGEAEGTEKLARTRALGTLRAAEATSLDSTRRRSSSLTVGGTSTVNTDDLSSTAAGTAAAAATAFLIELGLDLLAEPPDCRLELWFGCCCCCCCCFEAAAMICDSCSTLPTLTGSSLWLLLLCRRGLGDGDGDAAEGGRERARERMEPSAALPAGARVCLAAGAA